MSDSKFSLILMSINVFSFCTIDVVLAISAITFMNLLIINRSGHSTLSTGTTHRSVKLLLSNFAQNYNKAPITRTLKGNVKQFESAGSSCYRGKFSKNFD